MMKKIYVGLLIAVCLIGSIVSLSFAQTCSANETKHIVEQGQNLFRISLRYKVTMQAIATRNNIANIARIYAGQVLCIPGASPVVSGSTVTPTPSSTTIVYLTGTPTPSSSTDPRSNEYNWCNDAKYWGDGRCNTSNSGVTAYMYRLGWYIPRILVGEYDLSDVAFLLDDVSMLESIDSASRRDIQLKLRLSGG